MGNQKTYLSIGDIYDLVYKIKQKGYKKLLLKFKPTKQSRTISKWNTETISSDFWVIPEIRRRWNKLCTGNPDLEYEDYVVTRYLSGKEKLKMLSIGCGTGARERKFAKYPHFELIEGIDMAPALIEEAKKFAENMNLSSIKYHTGDFNKYIFSENFSKCV